MSKITCTGCGTEKDAGEFYASSKKKCKACVLKRQKDLKESKDGGAKKSARGTSKSPAKRKAKAKVRAAERPADSRWEQPGGFGFAVELQVDEATKSTDVHLEQSTKDLGEQNIWLSQHEARSLQSWLNEKLGVI